MTDEVEDVPPPVVEDTTYNSSDPVQVEGARKKAGKKKVERLRVVGAIMEHADGRKWLYGILERCHIFGNPFVPGQSDSTAFNLGEANIGRLILSDCLAANSESYTIMMTENSGK